MNVYFSRRAIVVAFAVALLLVSSGGKLHAAFDFQPLPLEHAPTSMAVSEDGKTLFVAHDTEDLVSVVDVASGKILMRIETKEPKALLARGDQLLVANDNTGTISVFAGSKNWEKTDEVETGYKKFQALSAPLGQFYKSQVMVTCKTSEHVARIVVVDIKKDKHHEVGDNKVGIGVATVTADGKRYFTQNDPWSTGGINEIRDFAAAVAGKESDSPPFSGEHRWLLYQVRPGNYWFGNLKIHSGMPPLPAGNGLGYMLVPDRVENVCYGLTDKQVICYAINSLADKLGEQPATFPKEYNRFTHREPKEGLAPNFNKGESDEYGFIDRYQVAATLDKKLHFYLISTSQKKVFHATDDAFDLSKAPATAPEPTAVASDNSSSGDAGGSNTLPSKVRVGSPVTLKLSGAAGSSYELVSGPASAKVAADGTLTWTPAKADAGEQQFKIKVKSGAKVDFVRLKTEVVDLTDIAKNSTGTPKTNPRETKPPTRTSGKKPEAKEEDIDLDAVGIYPLDNTKPGLSYSLDGKSLLAVSGKKLYVIDASGLAATATHEFENRYYQIAERPDYYVAMAAKSIDLIDKQTFKVKRAIDIDYSQLVSMAIDPTRKVTYVAVAKPSVKSVFGSKPVLEVNESSGETRLLKDVAGQWLFMPPQGKRLYTAMHELFEDGMTWDVMGIRARYGSIDVIACYDVSGATPQRLSMNEQPGKNGRHFEMSTDGLQVGYAAGGGAGGNGYSIAAFAADDVSRESSRYKVEAYPIDIAFHPTLNIVACCNHEHIWLFNRKTGEPEPERLDEKAKYKDIERLYFAPGGARLMVVYKHSAKGPVMQALPIKLSEKEQADAQKTAAAPKATAGATASATAGAVRTWTDKTGEHKIEAELVGVENGMAVLKRTSGNTIRVAIDQLSAEDQTLIKQWKP